MTTTTGIGGSGYDLEALSAYADRGRTPAIAAIDDNPECQAVLDSIERLGMLQRELLDDEVAVAPPTDEGWIQGLLATITREVRAGKDLDFPSSDPATTLVITEGAVREAVRNAGDSIDGVLVGRVRIDVGADQAATVSLEISVAMDRPLAAVAAEVRGAVHTVLLRSTPLVPTAIDVTVSDVHLPVRKDLS